MTVVRPPRGFSAVELVISVAIMSIGMVIIGTMLLQSARINKSQQLRVVAQSDARTCLAMIVNKLRTAGWDPTTAGIQLVQLDTDLTDGIDEIEVFADLDGDGSTTGTDEQVLIRHIQNRIEWRRSASGSFEILATGISNDSDGDGTTEQMFVPDSTVDPQRITVQITAESPATDPAGNGPVRYTVSGDVVLRKAL